MAWEGGLRSARVVGRALQAHVTTGNLGGEGREGSERAPLGARYCRGGR